MQTSVLHWQCVRILHIQRVAHILVGFCWISEIFWASSKKATVKKATVNKAAVKKAAAKKAAGKLWRQSKNDRPMESTRAKNVNY